MLKKSLSFKFDVKDIAQDGTFTGFAAVYGNVDQGGDVIDPGAFKTTLAAKGGKVPILWQHNSREPIGMGTLTDSKEGLLIHGKLSLKVARAQEAYTLLQDEILKGLSIGYEVVQEKMANGVRYLKEIKLFEVSLVTFPMNEMALVTGVKSAEEIDELLATVKEAVGSDPEQIAKVKALAEGLPTPAATQQSIDPGVCLQSMFEVQFPSLG